MSGNERLTSGRDQDLGGNPRLCMYKILFGVVVKYGGTVPRLFKFTDDNGREI